MEALESTPVRSPSFAFVAFEAAAAQAVVASEVADRSSAPCGSAVGGGGCDGAEFLAAGDVHRVSQALERGVGPDLVELAVYHHLPQLDVEVLQLRCGGRQQRVLALLPIWLERERMNPRAPRFVLAVISHT